MQTGKAFKYGDHVDTDVIIPARHLNNTGHAELAKYCMEDIDATFVERVQQGDVIVAGNNFGCGSSREHAPIAIKASGITCVIARSFARIFYRNSFNIGLPILECPEAVDGIEEKDQVEIDFTTGKIYNRTQGTEFETQPIPQFMQDMIAQGGLLAYIESMKEGAEDEV
jgi:3-isopropylmalate/(R)-2-methylmalate dehydratase small subunit